MHKYPISPSSSPQNNRCKMKLLHTQAPLSEGPDRAGSLIGCPRHLLFSTLLLYGLCAPTTLPCSSFPLHTCVHMCVWVCVCYMNVPHLMTRAATSTRWDLVSMTTDAPLKSDAQNVYACLPVCIHHRAFRWMHASLQTYLSVWLHEDCACGLWMKTKTDVSPQGAPFLAIRNAVESLMQLKLQQPRSQSKEKHVFQLRLI